MITIDVRRHAERVSAAAEGTALTEAGLACAQQLGTLPEVYALIISSPRARASETARAIGRRVDRLEPAADVAPDEVLTTQEYEAIRTLLQLSEHLQHNAQAHRFATTQVALWERIASDLADGSHALLVTHGGNIELGAALLIGRAGGALGPLPLGYCDGIRVRFPACDRCRWSAWPAADLATRCAGTPATFAGQ